MIKVLYFARLRETLGLSGEELGLPQDATVAGLMALLTTRGNVWSQAFDSGQPLRAAVNQNLVKNSAVIKDGDEVAFFPPVTGG